ncbi:MAG: hypothetical protein M3Q19_14585 [Pseudomonadota bacterium]|nr:hypothetical protein [Pseudomonadota bacterium]
MGNPEGALSLSGGDPAAGFDGDSQGRFGPDLNSALARNALMPETKPYKGMFPGKDWKTIVGILADAAAAGFGGQPQFGPAMMRKREAEEAHNRQLDLWRQKVEFEREERMRPRVEQVGGSLGVLNPDPANPSFNPVYQVPGAPEQYARARGLTQGTPEYADAVQEYRLGSWSDPALEAKAELEGIRHGYRDELQDERLSTSRRNTDVRAGVTKRGQNMTDSRVRRGQELTDERVRGSAGYQGKGGKGGKAAAGDLIGPVYVRGKARVQFSKSQNKYVAVP